MAALANASESRKTLYIKEDLSEVIIMFNTETLSKIVTLNKELLSKITFEDVIKFHPLIDSQKLTYQPCQKVKPMKVKPVSAIFADRSVLNQMLLKTLEANEGIKEDGFVCWGVENDFWMQTEKKLHDKYVLSHCDPDGWIHADPKPENPFNCCQIKAKDFHVGPSGGFCIINGTATPGKEGWGDKREINGQTVFLQYGIANDYVLQAPADKLDTYCVRLKFFVNTYEVR
jgi:hypothetical protein